MKKLLIVCLILLSNVAHADQYVQGHYRKDGTYVQPYHRSAPDNNPYNNYSTSGNVNPYTGQQGYVNPAPQQAPVYGYQQHGYRRN